MCVCVLGAWGSDEAHQCQLAVALCYLSVDVVAEVGGKVEVTRTGPHGQAEAGCRHVCGAAVRGTQQSRAAGTTTLCNNNTGRPFLQWFGKNMKLYLNGNTKL